LLTIPNEQLRARAQRIITALADLPLRASIGQGKAQVGGGTLPRAVIGSVTVDVTAPKLPLGELCSRLCRGNPPVIGYVSRGRLKLDLRTVFPRQDRDLIAALQRVVRDA
jgi:L-seryl-tRNA(Ser) seleniumtransferase